MIKWKKGVKPYIWPKSLCPIFLLHVLNLVNDTLKFKIKGYLYDNLIKLFNHCAVLLMYSAFKFTIWLFFIVT